MKVISKKRLMGNKPIIVGDSRKSRAVTAALLRHSGDVSLRKHTQPALPRDGKNFSAKIRVLKQGEMKQEDTTDWKRKLWNRRMPVLNCQNCAFSAQCPQFQAGYECAFLPFLHGHTINDEHDLIHYARELASENVRRAQQAMMMETMTGAMPSTEVSEQLALAFGQLMQLHERVTTQTEGELEMSEGEVSIIGQLFGDLKGLMAHTDTAEIERQDFGSPTLLEAKDEHMIGDADLVKDLGQFSKKHMAISVEELPNEVSI